MRTMPATSRTPSRRLLGVDSQRVKWHGAALAQILRDESPASSVPQPKKDR